MTIPALAPGGKIRIARTAAALRIAHLIAHEAFERLDYLLASREAAGRVHHIHHFVKAIAHHQGATAAQEVVNQGLANGGRQRVELAQPGLPAQVVEEGKGRIVAVLSPARRHVIRNAQEHRQPRAAQVERRRGVWFYLCAHLVGGDDDPFRARGQRLGKAQRQPAHEGGFAAARIAQEHRPAFAAHQLAQVNGRAGRLREVSLPPIAPGQRQAQRVVARDEVEDEGVAQDGVVGVGGVLRMAGAGGPFRGAGRVRLERDVDGFELQDARRPAHGGQGVALLDQEIEIRLQVGRVRWNVPGRGNGRIEMPRARNQVVHPQPLLGKLHQEHALFRG